MAKESVDDVEDQNEEGSEEEESGSEDDGPTLEDLITGKYVRESNMALPALKAVLCRIPRVRMKMMTLRVAKKMQMMMT